MNQLLPKGKPLSLIVALVSFALTSSSVVRPAEAHVDQPMSQHVPSAGECSSKLRPEFNVNIQRVKYARATDISLFRSQAGFCSRPPVPACFGFESTRCPFVR